MNTAPAHHGPLPTRSNTVKSDAGYLTDEDAVPDVAPSDTTSVLLERLQAWKHACAYLEAYVKATEKMLKEHSKDYSKVSKSIADPLREGHHFDQNAGGIAALFENMRTNTTALSNSYLEASKSLDGQVLPILERLHKEIKNKHSELGSGAGKAAKAVDTAKNDTQKRIELLGEKTAAYDSAGGKLEAAHDPFVIRRGVQHMLHKQVLEENNSREDIISVQKNFEAFEVHVVQTIQQAYGQLLAYCGGRADKEKTIYADITHHAQAIPPTFEWEKFQHRAGDMLITPGGPQRQVSHIQYPNMNHASTKPLIAGLLERKGRGVGSLTGYKTGYYAVTPAGFLHQFENDDDFRSDPSPELSLYLPDCTVGSVSGEKFNVKGKDVSKGKVGNALQMSHELAFKASTAADAQKWREIIASVATGTAELPQEEIASSPVGAGDRLPPPNTEEAVAQHAQAAGVAPVVDTRAAQAVQHPQATNLAGHGGVGQTTGVVDHASVPAAPATATTASPGAQTLGKGTGTV